MSDGVGLRLAVSVIVPCYDHERYLGETIESVIAQTLDSWEMIVVDDGSPGDIVSAMAPYRSHPHIRLVRQSNGGLCNARNAGYRHCSTESKYVLFLDADDVLEPDMLRVLVADLDRNPDAGMAFCDRAVIDSEGKPLDTYRHDRIRRYVPAGRWVRCLRPDEPDTPFKSLFAYDMTVPSLVVLRRSVFSACGGWDEQLGPMGEDTDMWLRVTLRSHARCLPHKLVRRRLHGNQLTRSAGGEQRRRLGRQKFERKWASLDWLAPADRRTVRRARLFREGRVLPYLWFAWALERRRRREPLEAAKCWLRGCRQLALYWPRTISLRGA